MQEPSDAPSTEQEIEADVARFEFDPMGYVRYAFPWGEPGTELEHVSGPRKWQKALFDAIGRKLQAFKRLGATVARGAKVVQKAVADVLRHSRTSGHGIGKSAFVAMFVMWALSTHEDTRITITANTQTQLHTKTSPEIAKWHRLAINSDWFVFTTTALYSSDPAHAKEWRADLIPWSEHNTEAFQGLHNQGKRLCLVFDEASAIADPVWEAAEGALTDEDTQIIWLAFGNPTRNTGRFRETFRKFKHRWDHEQIDSRTVEGVNVAQIQKWVEDYGEDSDFVKVRVRGMFPSASAYQFIDETVVDASYGRQIRPENFAYAAKILTLDPAWTGDDELVIGLRQGLHYRLLRTIAKNDNDVQVANMLARLEDEEEADAVFVDFGYGTGIVSVGRTLGRDWMLVNFGEKSSDIGCLNKRSQMWRDMRDWLREGGCIPADAQLHSELTSVETIPRLDSKLQLEDKEHMRARGVPSPGRADALALSFAYPVVKKDRTGLAPRGDRNTSRHEYDPLEAVA
jgi:hypothetical protein